MNVIQEVLRNIRNTKNHLDLNMGGKTKTEGTTILALKYDKGVIIAADTRCVAGETIFSDRQTKIEETGTLSCIAGSGYVSDFQFLVEILRNMLMPKLEKFWETEIFVDGQIKILKNIMRSCQLETWAILAGWDPFKKKGRIFLIEPGGATYEFKDYVATGSGGDFARTVLKSKWSKNCTEKEGIEIAFEALLRASEIDRNTAGPSKNIPTIKVISSKKVADARKTSSKKSKKIKEKK